MDRSVESGDYRPQALCEFFRAHVIETYAKLDTQIRDIFTELSQKNEKVITEYQRQTAALGQTMEERFKIGIELQEKKRAIKEDRLNYQATIVEMKRKLEQVIDQQQTFIQLNQIDILNLQKNTQFSLHEKEQTLRQLAQEIETIESQIRDKREKVSKLQNHRLKETTQLKNHHSILQSQYSQSKQKLSKMSESMALGQMYQTAKKEFDSVINLLTMIQQGRATVA